MKRTGRERASSWRSAVGRVGAVALAVIGLSALAFAPAVAGAATTPTTATVISTAKNAKLGTILVSGNTVYALKAGQDGLHRRVHEGLATGAAARRGHEGDRRRRRGRRQAGHGRGGGGALQITYGGKPLYLFVKDTAPGQVNGNMTNKWGKW